MGTLEAILIKTEKYHGAEYPVKTAHIKTSRAERHEAETNSGQQSNCVRIAPTRIPPGQHSTVKLQAHPRYQENVSILR